LEQSEDFEVPEYSSQDKVMVSFPENEDLLIEVKLMPGKFKLWTHGHSSKSNRIQVMIGSQWRDISAEVMSINLAKEFPYLEKPMISPFKELWFRLVTAEEGELARAHLPYYWSGNAFDRYLLAKDPHISLEPLRLEP
jgi:hypothetical protein